MTGGLVRRWAAGAGWFAAGALLTLGEWPRWRGAAAATVAALPAALPVGAGALARAALGHAAAAAGLACVLAAALSAGAPLAGWAGARRRSGWRLVAGWGSLSLLGFALGVTGLLRPAVLAAAAVALPLAGLPGMLRLRAEPARGDDRLPAALLAAVLLAFFLLARLPSTHEDPMAYHFAAPEEYLRAGRIHAELAHIQWTMPLGYEMLCLLPWWIGGITGAKLVNVAFVLTGCVAVARLARVFGGSGWWAALLFAAAGTTVDVLWQGKNDIAAAVFAAGAALGLARAARGSPVGWVLGGWCAGCAVACRLTAGLAVVPLGIAALVVGWGSIRFRAAAAAAVATGLACGPWLARSWLDAGNPFTLFLSGVFPDLAWSPFLQGALHEYTVKVSGSGAFRPSEIYMGVWRLLGSPQCGSGAILLLGLVGAVSARGTAAKLFVFPALVAYAAWLPTDRNPRFLFPLVPWFAALAAVAVAGGAAARPRLSRMAKAAAAPLGVAAALAAIVRAGCFASPDGPAVWAGLAGRDEVWKRQFTTHETTRRWANASLPRDARILLTGGVKRLGFGRRVMSTGPIAVPPFWRLARDSFTPAEVRKRLRQRGATHWLHNFVEGEFRAVGWYAGPAWDDREVRLAMAFMRAWARPVRPPPVVDHDGGGFWAFEFAPVPGVYPVFFVPGTEGRLNPAFDRLKAGARPTEAFAAAERLAGPGAGILEVQALLGHLAFEAADPGGVYRWLAPGVRAGFIGDGNLVYFAAAALQLGRTAEAVPVACRAVLTYGPNDRMMAEAMKARAALRAARGDIAGAARDRASARFWSSGTGRTNRLL